MAAATSFLGILGGTFDPPHIGHLILAEVACDALNLDQILFVLAGDPPHRRAVATAEHRLAMLTLAIAGNPRFALSDVDLKRPGPHYTSDMLRILREQFPDTDLTFLLGADSLAHVHSWHDPNGIIAQARLAAIGRPGTPIDLKALDRELPGMAQRVKWVEAPEIGISATLLRERLAKGHSIRYLVPESVERYIVEHGLYRNGSNGHENKK